MDERLSERAEAFTWAWACWRNGLNEQATRLYARAAVMPGIDQWKLEFTFPERSSFRERLKDDLSYAMSWRATLDFSNPKVSRPQLLKAFEQIECEYPRSPYAAQAHETADRLRAMVAEDGAHAALPAVPLESLPVDQQIAELIFRLRDYNPRSEWESAPPNASMDNKSKQAAGSGKEKSPAAQLVQLGFAAVPQLIDAPNNKRFSRSEFSYSNIGFSDHVLTVGDLTRQILGRIAGREFSFAEISPPFTSTDEEIATVKKQVQEWWRNVQQKGEKQVLIDAVREGGSRAFVQADELCKRYPDAALEAMLEGVKNTRDPNTRERLVLDIGQLPGDDAIPFLEEELRTGGNSEERLYAAEALWGHGHGEEALAAMIAAWNKLPPPRDGNQEEDVFNDEVRYSDLIRFLVWRGRVDAVEALGRNLRRWQVGARIAILSALDHYGSASFKSYLAALAS